MDDEYGDSNTKLPSSGREEIDRNGNRHMPVRDCQRTTFVQILSWPKLHSTCIDEDDVSKLSETFELQTHRFV